MCNVYPIFRLEAVSPYRNTDVWSPQIFSYSHRRLCLHVDFTRLPTLLCPDWTGLDSDSGSSAGLDWIRISGSWIWTGLDRFNSIHSILCYTSLIFTPQGQTTAATSLVRSSSAGLWRTPISVCGKCPVHSGDVFAQCCCVPELCRFYGWISFPEAVSGHRLGSDSHFGYLLA